MTRVGDSDSATLFSDISRTPEDVLEVYESR